MNLTYPYAPFFRICLSDSDVIDLHPTTFPKGWDGRYGIAVATDISEAHPGFMAFVGAAPW